MKSKQVNERSELQELKSLIIVNFVALVVLVCAAVNYYISLPDYEVVNVGMNTTVE